VFMYWIRCDAVFNRTSLKLVRFVLVVGPYNYKQASVRTLVLAFAFSKSLKASV